MSKSTILFFLLSFFFMVSCGDDDEVDPCDSFTATYDGDVNGIINASCAYAGCHSGGTTANPGIPVGSNDFTSFSSLESVLNSGALNARAIVAQDMPPAAFVTPPNPTELTAEQIEILICWRDAGYPEN